MRGVNESWAGWGGRWGNMKYVFKRVTPQQDLAGNMCALENGNDLLFKEVPECGISKNKKRKKKPQWNPKRVSPIQSWVLNDSQRDWICSIRKHHSLFARATNMLACCFHIHSPWSYVCLGRCHERQTNTARLVGYLKRLANYTAFCLSLQKAPRSLVGVWPDVFPVVLYCRMWWRELCPMVVVLARAPLTRWLRRWNMLIKLKTTSKNLHQIVTLVVSRATVRFIYCEACMRECVFLCTCVYMCMHVWVCQMISAWRALAESVSHGQASWYWYFLSDCLTRAVVSEVCLWHSLKSFLLQHKPPMYEFPLIQYLSWF